jgi:hypothetical protein
MWSVLSRLRLRSQAAIVPARRVLGLHFADDETILASPFDGLGDHVLGAAIAIKLGGVDRRHAETKAKPKRGDLLVEGGLALSHAPGALAELRHLLTGGQRDGGNSRRGYCQQHLMREAQPSKGCRAG